MNAIPCSYLRLSVTDRCFFDCFYCGAGKRGLFLSPEDYLSLPEILRLSEIFVGKGVRHIRLTGGEPLARKGLGRLIRGLAGLKGLEVLSLTTNGFLLKDFLSKNPGLPVSRINISLDTMDRRRFHSFTGKDGLRRVVSGIDAARGCGLKDIRLNVLLLQGRNDGEINDFVRFGAQKGLTVRFIEYFPTHRRSLAFAGLYVPSARIRKIIRKSFGELRFEGNEKLSGPAEYYRLASGQRIGFISSVTRYFCCFCNRLRVTADGRLFPCLHSDYCEDLKKFLKTGALRSLSSCISRTLEKKNRYNKTVCRRFFEMSSIGG
ncbi:MAG: radical SAM protein [Candidatus Omnitrophota bacterium]